jgi:Arc/MetJ-type ribon-helix-helix transcriptional regulator
MWPSEVAQSVITVAIAITATSRRRSTRTAAKRFAASAKVSRDGWRSFGLESEPVFPYPEIHGEATMQLNVPPDLEILINKRLSSGGYTTVEEVLRRALEAQDAAESWSDEERRALSAHIEEGFLQAERGELIDGAQARREIQALKESRLQERSRNR